MFRRYTDMSLRSDQILCRFPSHPVWHVNESYGFVTRLRRRVPLVEQELPTLPEHLSSSPVLSGVRVTRSLVLCVCFLNNCMSFCPFSFGHRVVCPFSIYGFWLSLWYLQTLLRETLYTCIQHHRIMKWSTAKTTVNFDLSLINYIFHSSSIVPKKAQKPIRFCIIHIDGNNVVEETSSYT
jgi:hypothetical protein